MQLIGKRIVLTGSTSGIGLELVRQLHNDNELIVLARPSASLEKLKSELPTTTVFEVDLSEPEQVKACGNAVAQRFDQIDVLINDAAIQNTPKFVDEDFSYDSIADEITVNLTSPCQLIAKLLPNMQKNTPSLILNINSGLGLVPKTSSAIYCATKGGLNIFSQSLAHQLEGSNVDVRQVFLPLVDTAMTHGRGTGKLSAAEAADRIIGGVRGGKSQIDIGKVKLLRLIQRLIPSLAQSIMKNA